MVKLSCATIKWKKRRIQQFNLVYSEFFHFRLGHYTIFTSVSSHGVKNYRSSPGQPISIFRILVPFVMSSNKSSDTLFHDSQSFIQTDKNFWRACSRCKKMSIKVSLETSCDLLPKHFHIFFCYCIRFIGANRNCLEFLELAQFTPIFSWVHLHITLCFRIFQIFVDFYPSLSLNLTLVYFSLTHVVLNDSRINFPSIYPQFSWIQFKLNLLWLK